MVKNHLLWMDSMNFKLVLIWYYDFVVSIYTKLFSVKVCVNTETHSFFWFLCNSTFWLKNLAFFTSTTLQTIIFPCYKYKY